MTTVTNKADNPIAHLSPEDIEAPTQDEYRELVPRLVELLGDPDAGVRLASVSALGEPTLTRNGVWMNEGTPRSAQPAVNSASCLGSPGVSFQPRGLPTKTCTARAATSSV